MARPKSPFRSTAGDGDDFDYFVLDDPDNPLILRGREPGFTSAVTRIEFPQPSSAATSLERSLAEQKHALVYGIYFKFARADIRPVSEPVLKEIAAILKNNPSWKLSIVGHTDNVGNAASRLGKIEYRLLKDKGFTDTDIAFSGLLGATGGDAANSTDFNSYTEAEMAKVKLLREFQESFDQPTLDIDKVMARFV